MGAFDDLIPTGPGPAIDASTAPANAFADLIPGKPADTTPIDVTPSVAGGPAKITVRPGQAEAAAAPSKGVMGYVDDAARALAQGATFGFADEIAAGANTLAGKLPIVGDGKSYEENLAAEKARNEAIPGAIKIPGEVAGAVGTTLATAPVTAAAATATGLARLPGLVRSILAGGSAGALFGAGNADPGLENRLGGAVEGAGVGAAAGGILHPVVGTLAAVGRGVVNAVSPRAQVAADLGRALRRDNMAPADLATAAADAQAVRPGVATLADAGGENVRGLVERVANTPGAGRTQVIPALTERQGQQAARLSMDLASLTGSRHSALEATKQTMEQRAKDATPLYDAAYNFNAREVPEIVDAFTREISTGYGKQAINSGALRRTLQTEYGIKDPTDAPLMVVIDAWKKTVDDMIDGAAPNAGRVLKGMKNRVLEVVDKANPAYAEARAAWSGPTQYLKSIEQGAQLASPKLGADEVRATLADMSAAQREAYTTGALSSIFRRMGNDPARLADMTKYLRSPEMRAKVEALMPTPEAAQAWRQRLDFEVGASELTGRALGNSRTAVRQAEQDQANGLAMDLIMDAAAGSPALSLLRRAVTFIPQRVRDTIRSRSDRVLADVLTNPNAANPADLQRLLAAAQQQMRPRSITSTVAPANAATAATEAP